MGVTEGHNTISAIADETKQKDVKKFIVDTLKYDLLSALVALSAIVPKNIQADIHTYVSSFDANI